MDPTLNPANWLGWSVESGTPGVSTPWTNQGGSFSGGPSALAFDPFSSAAGITGATVAANPLAAGIDLFGAAAGASQQSAAQTSAAMNTANGNIAGIAGTTTGLLSGAQGASSGATVQNYIIRGILIVMGLIFIAVGLNMFKPQAVLERLK